MDNSLLTFLQYDQIKEEFIKQDGLSLIMKFLYNQDEYGCSYSHTNQSDALELICILAFDEQVPQILKQNQLFMTTVKSILTIETANGVLWVSKNEEKTLNNNNNEQRNKDAYALGIIHISGGGA
ncbi:unnamed protein product, partial [Rotaria magnacalcarata]